MKSIHLPPGQHNRQHTVLDNYCKNTKRCAGTTRIPEVTHGPGACSLDPREVVPETSTADFAIRPGWDEIPSPLPSSV
jgi:hypothetical protein